MDRQNERHNVRRESEADVRRRNRPSWRDHARAALEGRAPGQEAVAMSGNARENSR